MTDNFGENTYQVNCDDEGEGFIPAYHTNLSDLSSEKQKTDLKEDHGDKEINNKTTGSERLSDSLEDSSENITGGRFKNFIVDLVLDIK